MINIEGFKNICQPSMEDLFTWISLQMLEYYGDENIVIGDGYLFCSGNIPAMLCAHLDTVHKCSPLMFVENAKTISSPQGIGGDDRCGVYAILSVLKQLEPKNKKPYLFFSTDEEVGGKTTKKAAEEIKDRIGGVGFMVELDRNGSKDSVYYECDNGDFKKFINAFGFVEDTGSFTDICTLSEKWDLAGVNLSVGYYNAHTLTEYVNLEQLDDTIKKVVSIVLAPCDVTYVFCKRKRAPKVTYYSDKYTPLFLVGDEVTTLRVTNAYSSAKYILPAIEIPAFKNLVIEEVDDFSCMVRVKYEGKSVWIAEFNIRLNS